MMDILTAQDYLSWQEQIVNEKDSASSSVFVCDGTGCRALGSQKVLRRMQEEISRVNLDVDIKVVGTGCPGYCEFGPLLTIYPEGISYQKIRLSDVADIVEKTLIGHELIPGLLFTDPKTGKHIHLEKELPFYQKQQRSILSMNGQIDPCRIEDYVQHGGYGGLFKVLNTMTPEQVIEQVKLSGLRGRGGGGFPTGRKWDICRRFVQQHKAGYIICNADEGDPGAFMDRSLMEGNPHAIIEGMIIGAYAIGVSNGYVYIRTEYPLAIENLKTAIKQAKAHHLLGTDILGRDFSFDLDIRMGAGAFVCGEETALIGSIEGKTGEPRPRPPYPAESGLWGKPTNINNVETWANIPAIIVQGGAAYAEVGTDNSKGTKIFSVVGKIKNTGLVEVPMGITLREIVYDIGGVFQAARLSRRRNWAALPGVVSRPSIWMWKSILNR